ncbi:hypothetical protein BLS_009498 [Venturia inaequalis]|uniref:Polyketide synthase n=1 Tax=Venturia inaequalis TaxID=5025 RepID=A0A8H3U4F0_VENIN|nr:hypothetical protein BLS_009498 [Venturia inaequalis]
MACRLPGASDTPSALWSLIQRKGSAVGRIPATRFNVDAFYSPVEGRPGSIKSDSGYFIESNFDEFDCGAFQISPHEAQSLDPQIRLLLECAWECFESAGLHLQSLSKPSNKIGCYVGSFNSDYADLNIKDAEYSDVYSITGSGRAMLSNRISYTFDLHGPSFTIDTGCSASMVAFHTACRAIITGECSSALVGGANLYLLPDLVMSNFASTIMSGTATCHAFDAAADGYGRGEGVSCVYLKSLSAALADGDPIRAIVRGTACNSDGKTIGISHPNGLAQELVIREAYRNASLSPKDTVLVECHGTGTPVGDPIETEVVGKVFGSSRKGKNVFINSIKANIGHSEASSGLSSVLKIVQALEHGVIPPQANFTTPNPNIRFQDWNLQVPPFQIQWPEGEIKRASLNNWVYGGTNVHAVFDAAESEPASKRFILEKDHPLNRNILSANLTDRPFLLPFSAHDNVALGGFIDKICTIPGAMTGEDLLDIAYTLYRRSALFYRAFITVRSDSSTLSELITGERILRGECKSGTLSVGFVFTGQGAQWPQMGSDLMDLPSVEYDLDLMQNALNSLPDAPKWDLKDELLLPAKTSQVHHNTRSQPLCTALQICLVNVLREWGISPRAVTGHSSGEIAAAYTAGVITMQEAIVIAYLRGKCVSEKVMQGSGAMMSVGLSPEKVASYLTEDISIACYNSPTNVTLSGPKATLTALEEQLKEKSVFARLLKTDYAYHSKHISAAGDPYSASLAVSGLAAGAMYGTELYWRVNLDSPVRFSHAMKSMLESGSVQQIVEIGPHSALAGPMRQIRESLNISVSKIEYSSTLERGKSGLETLLDCCGKLWLAGCKVDFSKINSVRSKSTHTAHQGTLIVDFPTYSWNKTKSYWWENRTGREWRYRKDPRHDLIGSRLPGGNGAEFQWRNILRLKDVPWLRDHTFHDVPVLPAAGHLAMALEGMSQIFQQSRIDNSGFTIREFGIKNALFIPEDAENVETFLSIRKHALHTFADSGKWWRFTVWSCSTQWVEHSTGLVALRSEKEPNKISDVNDGWKRELRTERWYEQMALHGLDFGPAFRGFSKLEYHAPSATLAATGNARSTYDAMPHQSPYMYHPTDIDICLQTIMSSFYFCPPYFNHVFVPVHIEEATFTFPAHSAQTISILAKVSPPGRNRGKGDVKAYDSHTGQLLMDLRGVGWKAMDEDPTALSVRSVRLGPLKAPYYRSVWKPDVDCLGENYRRLFVQQESETSQQAKDMERLAALCAAEMLARLKSLGRPHRDYHYHYVKWLEFAAQTSSKASYGENTSNQLEIDVLFSRLEGGYPDVDLMKRVYQSFEPLMTAAIEPIEILIGEDDLLSRFYSDGLGMEVISPALAELVNLLVHKNPAMRILEIGSGTGGTTNAILGALQGMRENKQLFAEYLYTDISPGFFENARERFGHINGLQYKVLDIEKSLDNQGFEEGSFDLIVAGDVLHATKTMKNTMANVRKLLKPGGKLVMVEITNHLLRLPFIMGILPGWWLGADEGRTHAPTLRLGSWDELLHESGFSGIDLQLDDSESEDVQLYSVIVTTALEQKTNGDDSNKMNRAFSVVYREMGDHVKGAIEELKSALAPQQIEAYPITEKLTRRDAHVIILAELEHSMLSNIKSEEWDGLKHLVSNASSILWVTSGAQMEVSNPESAMINGLARCIRAENGGALDFYILDLDPQRLHAGQSVHMILRCLNGMELDTTHEKPKDYEIAERKGIFFSNRLVPDDRFESEMATLLRPSSSEVNTTWMPGLIHGWLLDIRRPGELDTMGFMQDDANEADIEDETVEIRVEAAGLGWPDVLTSMGFTTNDDFMLGRECAGIVSRIGQKVSDIEVGDRDAAGSLLNFSVVLHSLRDIARIGRSQSVLIHNATGGIGLAAMQYCKHIGCEIFATVSNNEKRAHLRKVYEIPDDNIFNSRDASFYSGIMKQTGQDGVDVILSSMSGDLLHTAWRCLRPFGCFIDLRALDCIEGGQLEMKPFLGHRAFRSFDLLSYAKLRPVECASLLKDVITLFSQGTLRPLQETQVFSINQIEGAFRYLQSGKHIGKAIVHIEEIDRSLFHPGRRPYHIPQTGTILLVGGLGGLGRSYSIAIAAAGAKHVTFISRSGAKPEDAAFFKYLEDVGCKVYIAKGDIAIRSDVERIVAEVGLPVMGVIQGAMVLEDHVFADMAHESYNRVISAKVHGTLNLHEVLIGHPIQFFILLSSTSGIVGNQGQANYSAANTFLDCFARLRKDQGLPVTLIDLGMVRDVGWVAKRPDIVAAIISGGYLGVQEKEFLSLIQLSIQRRTDAPFSLQGSDTTASVGIVTGITPPEIESAAALTGERALWLKDARFSIIMAIKKNLSTTNNPLDEISKTDPNTQGIQTAIKAFEALKDDDDPTTTLDKDQKINTIAQGILAKISLVLGYPLDSLTAERSPVSYGLDSLVAVELRAWIKKRLSVNIAIHEVLAAPSIKELANHIHEEKYGAG